MAREANDAHQRDRKRALSNAELSYVSRSPLLFIASNDGGSGADLSPRGDQPGFVKTDNEGDLLIPDRIGNNRLDTLMNVLINPNVTIMFIVPGDRQVLVVSGYATISIDPQHLAITAANGKEPRSVLVIEVKSAEFSEITTGNAETIWTPSPTDVLSQLPSFGSILADQVGGMTKEQAEEFVQESYTNRLY